MSKEKLIEFIDHHKKELIDISMEIFNNPETNFKEFKASKLLAKKLEEAGFKVKLGAADLETAIYAEHPEVSKGPTVAILAEYDALPEIGHACGHNLIATAALGASLALGSIKKELLGKLIFMGTPAEEGGGGKIIMIEKGLFQGIDAAMMFHPSSNYTLVGRGGLALTEMKIEFFGQTAHASADPENGINALDAVIQTFNGISALRQHIPQTSRIHGIITDGGTKPNIIPDYAAASFYARALTTESCEELVKKIENIAKGAALITGADLKFSTLQPAYASRKVNNTMGEVFLKNLEILKVPLKPQAPGAGLGSSDIGNVSQVVPTIHPYLLIGEEGKKTPGHSIQFAKAASSEKGQEAMLNAAKALAMTAYDVLMNDELVEKIWKEFKEIKA